MKLLDTLAAGAILGLAAFAIGKHIQSSAEWSASAKIANRAIAQAKNRANLKESK